MVSVYSLRHDISPEALWAELKDCFRSLLLKAIAIHDEDNEWRNVLITGLLTYEKPDSLRKEVEKDFSTLVELGVTELKNLAMLYDIRDSKELPNVIRELRSGGITISNQYIRLRNPERIYVSYETYFIYRDLHEYAGIGVIVSSKNNPHSLKAFRNIEEELKSFGYNSINELGLQWLMVKDFSALTLEASIAIPIYLSNARLEFNEREGTIVFKAKVHKALLPKIKLLIALTKRYYDKFIPVENIIKRFSELAIHEYTEDFAIVELECRFKKILRPEDHIRYRIFNPLGILDQQDVSVERLLPKVPNMLKLFSEFISLDTLMRVLREKKVGRDISRISRPELAFQRAVAWLFTLLGYRVIELEGTRFKEFTELNGSRREVDVILYDEENERIYIVDCTIRAPESKKIDDIANAKESLLRKGINVEPLIVVGEIASETKKNTRRVKVLDLEDLERIISYLKQGDISSARELIML